jgi:hypothetical protein
MAAIGQSRGGSIVGCSQPINQRIGRQRQPNQLGDIQTHRPKLQLDPTLVAQHALHPMCLRIIIDANNVAHRQLAGDDLLRWHAASL